MLHVKSELTLPLALELENLAQTDLAFPELVDQVIVRPMVTRFRNFLQSRYDAAATAAQQQKTAAAEPPQFQPPATDGIRQPKSANGASFAMPENAAKPPLPQSPSSRGWAAG